MSPSLMTDTLTLPEVVCTAVSGNSSAVGLIVTCAGVMPLPLSAVAAEVLPMLAVRLPLFAPRVSGRNARFT